MNIKQEKEASNRLTLTITVEADRYQAAFDKDPENGAMALVNELFPEVMDQIDFMPAAQPSVDFVQREAGKDLIFRIYLVGKPDVVLGQYKGIVVKEMTAEISEDDIAQEIEHMRKARAEMIDVTGRPSKEGDTVALDFEGSVNGVAFEGGAAKNYVLLLGSHQFIDGFEEQLVGKLAGDDVDVHVTFPIPYSSKELEGKPALFKCKINRVMERKLPDITADFIEGICGGSSIDELNAHVREQLKKKIAQEIKSQQGEQAIAAAIDNASIELPVEMVNFQIQNLLDQLEQELKGQGISPDQYLEQTGKTAKELGEELRPHAEYQIREHLVIDAIITAENLTVTDEEINEMIDVIARAQYNMSAEEISSMLPPEFRMQIAQDLIDDKARQVIIQSMIVE